MIASPIKIGLKQKYSQFETIILMASRFSREKNIGLAIEAMAEIVKKYPKTGLVIVGSGPEKDKLVRLGRAKMPENFAVEPWANDLSSYYKSADIFLLTSNYEGWGMAVVEAMACACPVLMTDVGCAGELVINGQNGLVAPVGDKESLICLLEKMVSGRSLRQRLSQSGLETIKLLPNKEQYLGRYKNSWESIL
jgi:glycosyltransferase involved in cell wall biosynthesis